MRKAWALLVVVGVSISATVLSVPAAHASSKLTFSLGPTAWAYDVSLTGGLTDGLRDCDKSASERDIRVRAVGEIKMSAEKELCSTTVSSLMHGSGGAYRALLTGTKFDLDGTPTALSCEVQIHDPGVGGLYVEWTKGCEESGVQVDLGSCFAWLCSYVATLTMTGEPVMHYRVMETAKKVRGSAMNADCTITGTPGDDRLVGTSKQDVICGLGGDDVIDGLGGDDIIRGGPGDDVISGGAGEDVVVAGRGDDVASGGNGDDYLFLGAGDDSADPGNGRDVIHGAAGDDEVTEDGSAVDVFIDSQ